MTFDFESKYSMDVFTKWGRERPNDIVACSLRNDFDGVDTILSSEPTLINAQWLETGLSPLMAAAGRGLSEMVVHLLMKDGIDLFIKDASGRDAFDYGVPFADITELLMRARLPSMHWTEPHITPV